MRYTEAHLKIAVEKKIFSKEQVDAFRKLAKSASSGNLSVSGEVQAPVRYAQVFIAASALLWLITASYAAFGFAGLALFSGLYALAFYAAALKFFSGGERLNEARIASALAVAAVGLFLYALLKTHDFLQNSNYLIPEAGALVAAFPLLVKTKFPFIVLLMALLLWLFSMDAASLWFFERSLSLTERAFVSLIFGIAIFALGVICSKKLDAKLQIKLSPHLYLAGLSTFSAGGAEFAIRRFFAFAASPKLRLLVAAAIIVVLIAADALLLIHRAAIGSALAAAPKTLLSFPRACVQKASAFFARIKGIFKKS